jgi:hypothetical protein
MQKEINSRLQKGGAAYLDMRNLVSAWTEDGLGEIEIHSVLGKETMKRSRDTFQSIFKSRFIYGKPANAWKICQRLESSGIDEDVLMKIYYWITARSEAILYLYTSQELYSLFLQSIIQTNINEVVRWMNPLVSVPDINWSDSVKKRVASGMLATLKDFGILSGKNIKTIEPPSLSPQTFSLIAYLLNKTEGISGRQLLEHLDWRLFLLSNNVVEHYFCEAHQYGLLHYQSAGSIVRLEFPETELEDYVKHLKSTATF